MKVEHFEGETSDVGREVGVKQESGKAEKVSSHYISDQFQPLGAPEADYQGCSLRDVDHGPATWLYTYQHVPEWTGKTITSQFAVCDACRRVMESDGLERGGTFTEFVQVAR